MRIAEALAQEEARVYHLVTLLGRPQPCVSQRLPILCRTGLVINEKVVSSGRLPSRAEVVAMIATAMAEAGVLIPEWKAIVPRNPSPPGS